MRYLSTCRVSASRRRGITRADVVVVVACGVLCLAVVLPALANMARPAANRIKCASNLRQIALAGIAYAKSETRGHGKFPRTRYNPALAETPAMYTGIDTPESFADASSGGPQPNDVTAAFYLLLRKSDAVPEDFICPESLAIRLPFDLTQKSNFPGPEHLSYSYCNPYPSLAAVTAGWRFGTSLPPDHAFAADMNPGTSGQRGPTSVAYHDPAETMQWANSPNHGFEGQQVAYVDGHVEWQVTPFCGAAIRELPYRDNIYAADEAGSLPADGKGGIILAASKTSADFVMLPTMRDTRAGAALPYDLPVPGKSRQNREILASVTVVGGVALLLVAAAIMLKRRPAPATPPSSKPQ